MSLRRDDLLYPNLSYILFGYCYKAHTELGRYCREKQYCDRIEERLLQDKISYHREYSIGNTGNIADFEVNGQIIIETKARYPMHKEDYFQLQRYLQASGYELGILANFRYYKVLPIRVLRIEPGAKITCLIPKEFACHFIDPPKSSNNSDPIPPCLNPL